MRFVVFDFETASQCDLKKSGAWVYGADPTTEILCLSYTPNGVGVVTLYNTSLRFDPIRAIDMRAGSLEEAVVNPDVMFIAHNVGFEKSIWRQIMVPELGWPDIPDDRWHDTMAVLAMKALPLKLEKAAAALRLPTQKDTEGTKATLALGRTNKQGYYDRTPEKLQRVYDYCKSDVLAELEVHRRIKGLGPAERKVWLLDQTINQRGVRLDMDFVRQAQKICDDAAAPLMAEFRALTGVAKAKSPKLKDWLIANGLQFPEKPGRDENGQPAMVPDTSLDKEHIAKILGVKDEEDESLAEDLDSGAASGNCVVPDGCRRPLEILSIVGSASIKKLAAMCACCGSDGRARGLLQYHGAGPGRWSGRLLQPQNFPRPTLKIGAGWNEDGTEKFAGHDPEQLVAAIMTGDAEYVRMLFGEPILACINSLRHAIIAAPDHLLEVGDFAQVEARIVLAMAGQHDRTAAMARGESPYIPMAETIFGRKIDKHVDVPEYTIGKATVLGCGFQMGAAKFFARYCPHESLEYAKKAINAYREDFAPRVPKLWYALEEAAVRTVWDRTPHEAYGIQYNLEDGFLTARLHSGRKLWYYDPRPVRKAMPWDKDDIRPGFEYSAWKMGRWIRKSAYGGLLTENVVQATARDLMVNGMFIAEANGHPIVLTVHDEIVCEVPEDKADPKLLDAFMCDLPQWAKQMQVPIQTDCWTGTRYRK